MALGSWSLVTKQVEAQTVLRVTPGCLEEVTQKLRPKVWGLFQKQSRWVGHAEGRFSRQVLYCVVGENPGRQGNMGRLTHTAGDHRGFRQGPPSDVHSEITPPVRSEGRWTKLVRTQLARRLGVAQAGQGCVAWRCWQSVKG